MAHILPAMKAVLGDTEYYILSMKSEELISKVRIPKEIEGWDNLSIEERYQRDIDYTRVRTQIAPYLANNKHRFFGAIIVAATDFGNEVMFEPLSDVTTKGLQGLPGLYRAPSSNMGFLIFRGGGKLIPLDGQHRLKAIQFAIDGRDEKGKDIPNIIPCTDLTKEDVTVILVPYETKKAREIFTRVNRYARPTTAGQNYVTEDNDIIAVLAREVANELITARLVKYKSNTLSTKDPQFTTLAIIYKCNQEIIKDTYGEKKIDTTQLPEPSKRKLYRQKVFEVWKFLLENIDVFKDARADVSEKGDVDRIDIRKENLLGKPVPQECLIRAYLRLTAGPTNMSPSDACKNLNAIAWRINEKDLEKWDRTLWTGGMGGRIITKNRELVTRLITYNAGETMNDDQKNALRAYYLKQLPDRDRKGKELPNLNRE